MVHRIFHVLGDVLRHSQPRPPLGAGVLSADAFVPAVFRRFYGRAVGTFWKIIRMFSYSAAYFCPVYGRIYVVCHGLHPLGRLHGLQRRRFVPTGSGAAAGDPPGLPRGILRGDLPYAAGAFSVQRVAQRHSGGEALGAAAPLRRRAVRQRRRGAGSCAAGEQRLPNSGAVDLFPLFL